MRHILGLLGLVAASALVVVSAAMNWRFGFSLGNTEFDGHVYGMASVAADCLKAIVPFLIIYALKTKKWAQALAGIALAIITTGYSLTSSLGFAALNRADNNGARLIKVTNYNDTRSELKRLQEQLAWMPKHRPADAITAELQRANAVQVKIKGRSRQTVEQATDNCSLTNWVARKYCSGIFELKKELAISEEAAKIDSRIVALRGKISKATSVAAAGKTDPQADFISSLLGINLEDTQTVLILLVSLLVEAGSALGLFVVFAMWRMDESQMIAPARHKSNIKDEKLDELAPASLTIESQEAQIEKSEITETITNEIKAKEDLFKSDNDNDDKPVAAEIETQTIEEDRDPILLPKNEMDRYVEDRIEHAEGQSTTATQLYDDYCEWCEEQDSMPMSQIPFGKQLSQLKIKKAKIAGRIRYKGIKLKNKGMNLNGLDMSSKGSNDKSSETSKEAQNKISAVRVA